MSMRASRIALAVLLLSALPLFARVAPTISSISPNTIHFDNGEWFVEIDGSGFLPTRGLQVYFVGPAGTYTSVANAATDSELAVWVPGAPLLNPGTYSVTVRVPDGFGGTLTSNAVTFTVLGRLVWFTNWNVLLNYEATSLSGANVRFAVSAQSLYSDLVTIDCDHKPGDPFPFGRTAVNCTAVDDLGFGTKDSFTVDVEDTTPPTLKTPVDLVAFGSAEGANVKFDVTASDVVDPELPLPACAPASGDFFRLGTTTVTCTDTDRFKNQGSATFRVHVGSEQVPVLIVPTDITAEAASLEGEFVKYDVSATDIKGGAVDYRCDPPAGSLFPIGTTTVKCVAYSGLTATETFNVTVADTAGPVLSLPSDITVQAPDANGEYVKYDVTARDAVDGATSVSCSPVSGSLFPAGDTTVNCTSSDSRKNISNGSFMVHVTPWFDDTVYSIHPPSSRN
jgi:hypothetical protein